MATVMNKGKDTRYASTNEYLGVSTDTKSTISGGAKSVADLSLYIELDTGDVYYYDAGTDTWAEFGG